GAKVVRKLGRRFGPLWFSPNDVKLAHVAHVVIEVHDGLLLEEIIQPVLDVCIDGKEWLVGDLFVVKVVVLACNIVTSFKQVVELGEIHRGIKAVIVNVVNLSLYAPCLGFTEV